MNISASVSNGNLGGEGGHRRHDQAIGAEGGKHRIRVNSPSPGPVATEQTAFLLGTDEYLKIAGDFLVFGRVGKPADIAASPCL